MTLAESKIDKQKAYYVTKEIGKIIGNSMVKGTIKAGLNTISRPAKIAVDSFVIAKKIHDKKYVDASISAGFAIADTFTFGAPSFIRETGKEIIKHQIVSDLLEESIGSSIKKIRH